MALNPEWNLEDTVRQIPTVIFSSSSESEGTVRVKKEPEKVLKKGIITCFNTIFKYIKRRRYHTSTVT